ncbi:hypothetical protein GE061_008279 [Apolygus lucorum]|uniref:NADH dehydrogenase [ubiquinone] 1 beta subcomplex subunit 7 n=1 Tax=Apolygus lucorum TaxID=248454 RepID=A0A8S9WQV9_APOLU|nr:hypothetical protein GE061_008279 [Apolygus lucorum]
MGNIQAGIDYKMHPDVVPKPDHKSNWDPNYGFSSKREEKVMIATEEELHSAKISLQDRDYCAHKLLDYRKCYRENFPWIMNCGHEKHTYLNCEYDDSTNSEFICLIQLCLSS